MSQATIRNLVIFLLVNAIAAISIIATYFIKSKDEGKQVAPVVASTVPPKAVMQPQALTTVVNPTTTATTIAPAALASTSAHASVPTTPVVESTSKEGVKVAAVVPNKVEESNANKICVKMGPFNADEKTAMDFILNKNNQVDSAKVEKIYDQQLYWNLGKNKVEAEKLFSKQKEGAMADPKFTLIQNKDKDWVVNITKVQGTDDSAKKLLKDLEEKARKINAGGTWQYSNLSERYFYKFNDYKSLKEVTINSIDIMLKSPKEPC